MHAREKNRHPPTPSALHESSIAYACTPFPSITLPYGRTRVRTRMAYGKPKRRCPEQYLAGRTRSVGTAQLRKASPALYRLRQYQSEHLQLRRGVFFHQPRCSRSLIHRALTPLTLINGKAPGFAIRNEKKDTVFPGGQTQQQQQQWRERV